MCATSCFTAAQPFANSAPQGCPGVVFCRSSSLFTYDNCAILAYLFCRVQIFQMNKCSACDTSLQLPAVHFLCKHSYHAHCLESYSEKADSCPACTRDSFNEGFV